MGSYGHLYLHAECVVRLTIRLFRDLHELQCPDYYARHRELGL
jgi:hypothetical protein